MAHKARTQSENRGRANQVLKSAGYSGGGCAKLAKGGSVKGPKEINIIIKTGGGDDQAKKQAMQQGMMLGAKLGQGAGAPPPPPGGPPPGGPGGPPPGGPPGMPPHPMPPGGMMNTGGTVKVRGHVRRKAGGPV